MTNIPSSFSFLKSLNYQGAPTVPVMPMHALAKNSGYYSLPDELASGLYGTSKKIKLGKSCYSSVTPGYLLSDSSIEGSNLPEKKVLVKGHCYNLKGFSDKSCSNIKIIIGKRKNLSIESEAPLLYPTEANPSNTLKEKQPILKNSFEIISSVPKSDLSKSVFDVGKEEILCNFGTNYNTLRPIQFVDQINISQQMISLMKFREKSDSTNSLKVCQPPIKQVNLNNLIKPHPNIFCKKPLSTTAQIYIRKKIIEKSQEPGIKEEL